MIGSGLAPAALPHPELRGELENMGVSFPYALYLGRVEKNKGCETLFRHYLAYVEQGRPALPLVLAGPEFMEVPSHPPRSARSVSCPSTCAKRCSAAHAR